MGERVAADDRLVRLDREPGQVADQPADAAVICSVCDARAAARGTGSGRVRRAMTTSSREALPARSPRPLIVTSTWRAPAWTAASVLAVASPRSLWQWTLTVAWSPTRSTTRLMSVAELGRDGVADGVRDVDRGGARPRRPPRRPAAGSRGRCARRPRRGTRSRRRGRAARGRSGPSGPPRPERRLAVDPELVLEVDVARGDEHVEVRLLGDLDRLDGPLRIAVPAAGERRDRDVLRRLQGDPPDRLEVARARRPGSRPR